MNDIDFAKRMRHAPNEELLTVISSDGFVPAAVEAARAELERRSLDADQLTHIQLSISEACQHDERKPSIPLGVVGKITFLLIGPLLLISLASVLALRLQGYHRKSFQALIWTAISFASWFTVFIISDLFFGIDN